MTNNELVTKGDLQSIKNEIITEITQLKSNSFNRKKWIKSAEVQNLLKISPATLQTLRINKTVPFSVLGRTLFYDYDEILKILEENKSK